MQPTPRELSDTDRPDDSAHAPSLGMMRIVRRVGLLLAATVSVAVAALLIYRFVPRAFEGIKTAELAIALALLILPPLALLAMRLDAGRGH